MQESVHLFVNLYARLLIASLHSQVLEVQSAFLSNFEVLKLLQEDVTEQNKNYKEAQKLAKKAAAAGRFAPGQPYFDEQAYLSKIVPDNVRTLQVEVRPNSSFKGRKPRC